MKIICFALISTLISFTSFAASASKSLPACAGIDKFARVDTVCKTTAGYQFKRYFNAERGKAGWEDIGEKGAGGVGGKVWYDDIARDVQYPSAREFCSRLRLDVPSEADYKVGLAHGLAEVLPEEPGVNYWTGTEVASRDITFYRGLGAPNGAFVPTGPVKVKVATYPLSPFHTGISQYLSVRCNGVSGVNLY